MDKIIITSVGILVAALVIINAFFPQKGKKDKLLQEVLNEKNALLVDVRTPEEFKEHFVENSINIPLDTIEQNLDKFKGHEYIIVFCKSGRRSGEAKDILEKHGFTNVFNGGSWQNVKKINKG